MEFIYNSYFKHNPYPSLVLKPEQGSTYRVYDVNEAFLEIMQIEKDTLLDKDIFESFLNNEKNAASVVTTILKTSLAFVKTYWTPRKINKLPIIHSDRLGGEKRKVWEVYNCPVLDPDNELKFLILIAREIGSELDRSSMGEIEMPEIMFTDKKYSLVLQEFRNLLAGREDKGRTLEEAFQIVGERLMVGRLYFYKIGVSVKTEGFNDMRSGEWIKVGEWSTGGNLHAYDLPYDTTGEMLLPLSQRNEFCKDNDDIINMSFRGLLAENEVKSIYAIPLFLFDNFHGFLGIEDCKKERVWSSEEKYFFKCVASQFAAVLEKETEV